MAKAQGLRFRKLDLHVHTPASKCYQDDTHTPEDIVRAALEQGLDGIAITDHNTALWVDDVKAVAAEIGGKGKTLTVFPGVEISTHEGYHVIAQFGEAYELIAPEGEATARGSGKRRKRRHHRRN